MDSAGIPPAIIVHAAAAFLVLLLGPVNIFRPRRDTLHRWLGRTWVLLMYVVCVSSFFFGLEHGFTALHGLSIFTTVSVTVGVWAIVKHNRRAHVFNMVGSYIGTLIAFGFAALVPNRLIWRTTMSDPWLVAGFAAALAVVAVAWIAVLKARAPRARQRPAGRAVT